MTRTERAEPWLDSESVNSTFSDVASAKRIPDRRLHTDLERESCRADAGWASSGAVDLAEWSECSMSTEWVSRRDRPGSRGPRDGAMKHWVTPSIVEMETRPRDRRSSDLAMAGARRRGDHETASWARELAQPWIEVGTTSPEPERVE